MRKQQLLMWIAANALGMGLGFVVLMDPVAPFVHGLDLDNYWAPVPPSRTLPELAGGVVAYLVGGLVFGSAQALALRSRLPRVVPWMIATTAGFVLLALAVELPLQMAGIMGRMPGPAEPIIATVGSCSLAGVVQFLALRRTGILASRWLMLWVGGLVVSIVPTALVFMSLAELGVAVSWPTEVFLNGFICAGVAAAISGRALLAVVERRTA